MLHIAVLYFFDHYRNPNKYVKDHLVGRLTKFSALVKCSSKASLLASPKEVSPWQSVQEEDEGERAGGRGGRILQSSSGRSST